MKKTRLKIITPHGTFWDKDVDMVTLKTTEGYIGLMANKSPLVAGIEVSELLINQKSSPESRICAIAGGVVYAKPEGIQIITDAIEFKEKIDVNRAMRAKAKLEAQLKHKQDQDEIRKNEMALMRAINRINVGKS